MSTNTQENINEVVEVTIDSQMINQVSEGTRLATTVKGLTINNNQEYQNSGEFLKQIKTVSKILDDSRKEITRPLDEAKKRVMDFFREPLEQLSSAETVLKKALLSYQQAQERIRLEAERKAIAEAKAEEERKRKVLEERAAKAEEKGQEAKAEMLREQASDVYVPTVVSAPNVEKIKGLSSKKVWKCRITDEAKIPREYLVINEPMLNKMAQATHGKIPVPGVEFYQEEIISAARA